MRLPHAASAATLIEGSKVSGGASGTSSSASGGGVGIIKFVDKIAKRTPVDSSSSSGSGGNDDISDGELLAQNLRVTFSESRGRGDTHFRSNLFRPSVSSDYFYLEHSSCTVAYSCNKLVTENRPPPTPLLQLLMNSRNPLASMRAAWFRKTTLQLLRSSSGKGGESDSGVGSGVNADDDSLIDSSVSSQTVSEKLITRIQHIHNEAFNRPLSR